MADTPAPEVRKRKRDSSSAVPSRSAGTYERKKAGKACLVCRARKTKCDNARPVCGFCKATGGECQYSGQNLSRLDQASLTIIEHLNRLEDLIKPISTSSACRCCCSTSRHYPHEASDHGVPSLPQPGFLPGNTDPAMAAGSIGQYRQVIVDGNLFSPEEDLSPQDPRDHTATHDGPGCGHVERASENDRPPRSATLMRASSDMGIEAILQWPIFMDRLSHLSDNTLMEDLGQPPSPRESSSRAAENTAPGETISLDPGTVSHLVENFLVNNFPSNPILDVASLRRDARQLSESGLCWDGRSCLVLLVLAIGSVSTSITDRPSTRHIHVSRDDSAFRAAEVYFQESQRRIGALSCENSLLSTQCAFFTAVYLSYTMRIFAAWKWFVMAGTQCLGYLASRGIMDIATTSERSGRNASHDKLRLRTSGSPEPTSRALEESLYWVILKGEAELCLELGLAGSGLNENPYPHTFPSPPDLDETAPSPGTLFDRSKESDRQNLITGWLYYLGEIALRRLQNRVFIHYYSGEGDIVGDVSAPQSHADLRSSVAQFDSQLEQWMQYLPHPLQFSPASTEGLDDQLRWVLCGHRIDVIEILRFPAFRSVFGPRTTSAGEAPPHLRDQNPADTLRLASEYLHNAVQRIEISAEGFLHRHQGSWLTIRGCTRSALNLLGAKLSCQDRGRDDWGTHWDMTSRTESLHASLPEDLLPPRWEDAVVRVLDMLRVWETESKDVGKLREIVETLLGFCRRG